jgi:hypothetical protein
VRLTRREVLFAGAGVAAGPLRGKEVLPSPDFSLLRETNPYLIGVRPHRKGGVNLSIEAAGKKWLVHNYGHGGGGVTLSWGSAATVVEQLEKAGLKEPSFAVLGSGVIGLTTATELRRRWPNAALTVFAKDLDPKNTTSWIAGGQFEPSGIFHAYESPEQKKVLAALLRKSKERIVGLQASKDRLLFGVAERKNYTLDHENKGFDLYTPSDVVAPYRTGNLPFEHLNAVGREYSTWLMNPTILLPKLIADLKEAKATFEAKTFASRDEVLALPQTVIVNCTGYGARALFGDETVVPQRGHLVVLKKTEAKQFYFFSGGCMNPVISYAFCRQDDIVIGGTVVSGDDRPQRVPEDDATFEKLITNSRALFDGKVAGCVP